MAIVPRPCVALALLTLASCGAEQRGRPTLAQHCEVRHNLRGQDEVEGRVDRVEGGWVLTLRMRVHLGDAADTSAELSGQGRVTRAGDALRCEVIEAPAANGAQRFDEALCLDEFESLAGLIQDAEASARPGETVVQEVSLRRTRRRRARSRVGARVVSVQERAEVTRDGSGRVVRLSRSVEGGREEVIVDYPARSGGQCIVAE